MITAAPAHSSGPVGAQVLLNEADDRRVDERSDRERNGTARCDP
jgi:hypothetical protein